MNPDPKDSLPFSLDDFEAEQSEILLRMGDFFLAYLHRLRGAFDGDLMMAIVLGEIGHHNASVYYHPRSGMKAVPDSTDRHEIMECCNAHSLSEATGIPRETIRRKITKLLERGWIEKVEGQGLRITPACVEHFAHSFNVPTLAGLLSTASAINELLAGSGEIPPTVE